MTQGLLDLLAARASAQQNGPALDMLARLREGGSLPSGPELLAQLGNTNPMLGLLAQQFMQRATTPPRDAIEYETIESQDGPDASASASVDATAPSESTEVVELHERIAMLTGETQDLSGRLGQLADALGACGLCWGEDRDCRACRGRGRPGYALPDEHLFEELVLPAVRVLRAQRLPRATVTPLRAADAAPLAMNVT